jgi:hypothetical protein
MNFLSGYSTLSEVTIKHLAKRINNNDLIYHDVLARQLVVNVFENGDKLPVELTEK